jgi:hypothetical protein
MKNIQTFTRNNEKTITDSKENISHTPFSNGIPLSGFKNKYTGYSRYNENSGYFAEVKNENTNQYNKYNNETGYYK